MSPNPQPGSLAAFVRLFSELDSAGGARRREAAMRLWFTEAPAEDAAWALTLLAGRTRRRHVSSRRLREIAREPAGLPDWLFAEAYAQVGDSAETIALLCAGRPPGADAGALPGGLSLGQPLHRWMTEVVPALGGAEAEAQQELFTALWTALDVETALVVNKLFTGGFRVGVSERSVLRALSAASGVDLSLLSRRMTAWKAPGAEAWEALLKPDASDLDAGAAYPFFLASPLEDPDALDYRLDYRPQDWIVEWKWDGIRLQIIKREGTVTLWSRGEEAINTAFPELATAMQGLPDGTVIDCELLARGPGEIPGSFAALQKRLGRRKPSRGIIAEVPVFCSVYDLLELGGRDIREEPLEQRRQTLASLLGKLMGPPAEFLRMSRPVPEKDVAEAASLELLRQGARQRGVEGLMLKRRGSPYRSGRVRGDWWKYKADPFELDAVLVYAQAGSGKRANLFTDYTFALWHDGELVPFAKAYSGLDNAEIHRLDRWIRRNTTERFGPARAVEAQQVFTIGFEGIAESRRHKSGVAVRFPRILRWREDKPAQEADTLDLARALLESLPQ